MDIVRIYNAHTATWEDAGASDADRVSEHLAQVAESLSGITEAEPVAAFAPFVFADSDAGDGDSDHEDDE